MRVLRVVVFCAYVVIVAAGPLAAQHLPMPVENQSSEGAVKKKRMPDLTAAPPPPKPAKKNPPKHTPAPHASPKHA
jgi:hypothetical protein